MQPPIRSGTVFEPSGPGDPPLIGGYRVLARIGAGPAGRVHLAVTQSGRALAVKVVAEPLAGDAEFRRRFKREIADAQRARGPFLAQVVDGHAEDRLPWVAAEYVPGPSLADAVTRTGALPAATVRALAGAAAEALGALHDAALVHGDLRPSNVLLAEDGPRLVGFASREHGTTPAGDVYALGRLALFAATGRQPDDLGRCPDELRDPIERCLAGDPADRPAPGELAAELEAGRPGPGWLPPEVAALLPAYAPVREPVPPPEPERAAAAEPKAAMSGQTPPTDPDVPGIAGPRTQPNFAVPLPPEPQIPPAAPPPPVMGSYRNDLAIALGIGGGVFFVLVLILVFMFLS